MSVGSRACRLGPMGVVVIGLVPLGGCTTEATEELVWQGYSKVVDGVRVVVNPDTPLLPEGTFSLDHAWSISSDAWAQPTAIGTLHDRLYLLDPKEGAVHIISTGGETVNVFGRLGSGPGELRSPVGIATTSTRIVVGDGGNGRLELFTPDGAYASTVRLSSPMFQVAGSGGDLLLIQSLGRAGAEWRAISVGDETAETFTFPSNAYADTLLGDCARVDLHHGIASRVSCYTPVLVRTDLRSGRSKVVRVDKPASAASDAELEYLRRTVTDLIADVGYPPDITRLLVEQQVDKQRFRRSLRKTLVTAGMVLLWEQTPEELGGSVAVLHIFSVAGVYLGALQASTPWADVVAAGRSLYALEVDTSTGLVGLSAYRIRVSSNAERWLAEPQSIP